jgi:hypothetical protein
MHSPTIEGRAYFSRASCIPLLGPSLSVATLHHRVHSHATGLCHLLSRASNGTATDGQRQSRPTFGARAPQRCFVGGQAP